MSVHDGIKYQCDHCDYKATTQYNLKKHKMSVHEVIKYQCDICGYKAVQKGTLKIHQSESKNFMKV